MQIIYTCPQCGSDLQDITLTCNPPISKRVCNNCGWNITEPIEDVVRIPYLGENVSYSLYDNPACQKCSNNPINGGSGICHCILGNQIIY